MSAQLKGEEEEIPEESSKQADSPPKILTPAPDNFLEMPSLTDAKKEKEEEEEKEEEKEQPKPPPPLHHSKCP